MATKQHIHTYVQFKARPGYWRCAASDCTHFIIREIVIGKFTLCPDCGTQFTLTYEHMKRKRPLCNNCADTKEARAWRLGQQLVKDLPIFNNTQNKQE